MGQENIELLEALKEAIKPGDEQIKKFLRSDEGKAYIEAIYEEGNPLALFFLSTLIKDERGEPFSLKSGALRLDFHEAGIDMVVGESQDQGVAIRTGDKWLQLHVVEEEKKYAALQPMEKIDQFITDLIRLLEKLEQVTNTDPQKGITYDSPIIGVSHLVKLVEILEKKLDHKIIWQLSASDTQIPPEVMDFFAGASTSASKKFGGEAAQPENIKVFCARARDLHGALKRLKRLQRLAGR